jgi:HSP90 family molecular chaperone
MAPYRSRREDKPAAAPRTGLVADMVRQFADPYAFLRELIQNGIDAGASSLSVHIAREDGDLAITTVNDDGAGMTPEIMEGPLLTLFSSSKEDDLSKIGKYGVGFVSVFALEPEEVQVVTWRDGRACLLRLHVDHRYTIEEAPPRSGSGTSVALLKRMVAPTFAAHVASARESLRRWCRHAERPIRFRVSGAQGHDGEILAIEERVDAPFSVAASITVTTTIDDEVFVLGPSAGATLVSTAPAGVSTDLERSETFAGFYNRGLTLGSGASASR